MEHERIEREKANYQYYNGGMAAWQTVRPDYAVLTLRDQLTDEQENIVSFAHDYQHEYDKPLGVPGGDLYLVINRLVEIIEFHQRLIAGDRYHPVLAHKDAHGAWVYASTGTYIPNGTHGLPAEHAAQPENDIVLSPTKEQIYQWYADVMEITHMTADTRERAIRHAQQFPSQFAAWIIKQVFED